MTMFSRILLAIVALLVLADLSWHVWIWDVNADYRAAAKQVKVVGFHTNDLDGVGIVEAKTGKPLWVEWHDSHGKTPDEVSYFFHGTNVLNLYLREGKPPAYEVVFH